MNVNNEEWNHVQYFILLDFRLASNLSFNVSMDDIDHVEASFYGSLFNNLTTRFLWDSNNGKYVTLHTLGRNGLFSWGQG